MNLFELKFYEMMIIILGTLMGCWGLFHQLIVGGVASLYRISGNEGKIIVLSWIAHGGYISFLGFLPALQIFLHGIHSPEVISMLIILEIALFLLIVHSFISGFKTHPRPVKIGIYLKILFFLNILAALLMQRFQS